MRKAALALLPLMTMLLLSGLTSVHAVVSPPAGTFKATVSPTSVSTDGNVTITICPNPGDCAYPVVIRGANSTGLADKGGITVSGPGSDTTNPVEWVNGHSIKISSGSFTLMFGTKTPDWLVEDAGAGGCTGYVAALDGPANTHCQGAYTVVLEGTAGLDVTGAPVGFGESGPETGDEFIILSACPEGSEFTCSFTVPEFGAPVIAISAVGLLLLALYKKQRLQTKS